MARLAEQAERFEDMVTYMKRVVMMGTELSLDERNLLFVAYKNLVGYQRQACRVLHHQEERETNEVSAALIRDYNCKVNAELEATCNDALELLDGYLINKASSAEAKVFFMKMKGDYHRYRAEFKDSNAVIECAKSAHSAYQEALTQAQELLSPANQIRLGLALNFSVFFNEVMGDAGKAMQLAHDTWTAAQQDFANLDEEQQRDSQQILQLLHDNLTLWTSSQAEGEGKPPEQDGTAVEEL